MHIYSAMRQTTRFRYTTCVCMCRWCCPPLDAYLSLCWRTTTIPESIEKRKRKIKKNGMRKKKNCRHAALSRLCVFFFSCMRLVAEILLHRTWQQERRIFVTLLERMKGVWPSKSVKIFPKAPVFYIQNHTPHV